jgi:cysteine desulfurase/selenocysteine lyase
MTAPRQATRTRQERQDLVDGLLRDRFPILAREVNGQPLVYLDSAATSQKPAAVIEAESSFYRRRNANVHRGLHTLGDEATRDYENCRALVASWLGAADARNVVIQRSATAALNLVAHGLEPHLRAGDEILLTEMEHHANLVPWQQVARATGARLRFVPITAAGELDRERFAGLLGDRTRVVALTHASNVLGTINPVAEIAAAAHERGALVVVDAAQSVGHMPVDFAALGADLLAFSAHKVYGPLGIGFLIGRREALERLEPVEGGGEMIEWVEWESATWAEIPQRFEAGTPNVSAASAFPAAIHMLDELGLDRVRAHERDLAAYAWQRLQELGGLTLYGPADPERRGGLISFHDPDVHPHDLSTVLDQLGIAVRAGHHCAQPLHRRLGVVASTRASFGIYSNRADVDALIDGIREARKVFRP